MIETDIIKVTMDLLYKPGCELTELLVMLLVNLTKVNTGVESLLQVIRNQSMTSEHEIHEIRA